MNWWIVTSDSNKTRIRLEDISAIVTERIKTGKQRMIIMLKSGERINFESADDHVIDQIDNYLMRNQ